jgi:hypothetical protein
LQVRKLLALFYCGLGSGPVEPHQPVAEPDYELVVARRARACRASSGVENDRRARVTVVTVDA